MRKNIVRIAVVALAAVLVLSGCGDVYDNLNSQLGKEPVSQIVNGLPVFEKPVHDHDTSTENTSGDTEGLGNKITGAAHGAVSGISNFLRENNVPSPSHFLKDVKSFFQGDVIDKKEEEKHPDSDNSEDRSAFDLAFQLNSSTGALVKVSLKKVVDGDTLLVDFQGTSSYIRLIGINTPESVAPDEYLESTGKENTAEGSAASKYTKQVLIDKKYVYLEFDASEYDNYGRILAYVWIKPDKSNVRENMLNAKLLESGHAELMSIEPNTRYKEEFEEIQCQALTMGE